MATDYVPHDDGTVSCPRHVEAPRFLKHIGCQACIADPPDGDGESLTPKADELLLEAAVREADGRGIPDMLGLEKFANRARKEAKAEVVANRKMAKALEEHAQKILDGNVVPMERDREGNMVEADHELIAIKFFGEAAKYRMAVQKGLDVQSKFIKMGLHHAAIRFRAKQKWARSRLTGKDAN